MLQKQAIEVLRDITPGFNSQMFVIPKKNGKWRPIIDISPLNKMVDIRHFKTLTPASILATITKGQWMTSIDLSDAYFHVPIHFSSRKYLRFVTLAHMSAPIHR